MAIYNAPTFRAVWRTLAACLVAAIAVGVLAGCGSGVESSSSGSSGSGVIIGGVGVGGTGVIRSSMKEAAVDTGLIGALVFQDKNGNRLPDQDEPSAVTDQNGFYSLSLNSAEASGYPLFIMATAGSTIVKATGQVVTVSSVTELGQLPGVK